MDFTTIKISTDLRDRLSTLKDENNTTYEEVIESLYAEFIGYEDKQHKKSYMYMEDDFDG